ncbi:serine hydrolase domain-containing protein [Emticicia sp. C21]|uniref:serine hydrolase domain-containing protein n=1 Tax=Emticicia sp. C21 TaxID=2302915 RepID=UPI000E355E97|nr:serine hydrolase domain-containing protein [Emticicia sp. C21]RFS17429.1 tetratricopeptide repeat protein [Emticicia sp. C21]
MKNYLILTLLFAFTILKGIAQSKAEKLAEVMKAYHGFNMFDGSVLVAENGKVIYKGAFGMANREWDIPNTVDTKFMIGSVSKPLTAMLMLIQVQKGLVNLDKTISDYLPEYSKKNGSRITIRQLLSHTSGIPNYDIIKDFFPRISRQNYSREDYIKLYMDSTLVFEPGKSYYYSSWGYYTLGYIMEKVSGKSYSQLMKEDIFDKLQMNSSGSYYHTRIVPKRATGYDYIIGGYTSSDFRDQSNTMGTGDIYSTVEDLFKLHIGISNNSLINQQLTDEMFKPGIRPWRYGFGWFNQQFRYTPKDSVFANYHLGMTEGFLSFLIRIPSTNSLVVFLCNSSPTHFFGITQSLLRVLYNKPVQLKQPAHKAMETVIATKGTAEAVKAYPVYKKDTANYYIDWLAMDQLGNQLFADKRYNDALLIFENNAKEFPQRDLVLISIAKTYEVLKRKDEAIEYYKKAIVANPNNEEPKNRLKELERKP